MAYNNIENSSCKFIGSPSTLNNNNFNAKIINENNNIVVESKSLNTIDIHNFNNISSISRSASTNFKPGKENVDPA